jgi:hypothetical protein
MWEGLGERVKWEEWLRGCEMERKCGEYWVVEEVKRVEKEKVEEEKMKVWWFGKMKS